LDEQVDVDMLAVGDELVMHPGEKVAAYGVVYRDGCARPRRNQKPRRRWRP
jgi:cation transport ATPase